MEFDYDVVSIRTANGRDESDILREEVTFLDKGVLVESPKGSRGYFIPWGDVTRVVGEKPLTAETEASEADSEAVVEDEVAEDENGEWPDFSEVNISNLDDELSVVNDAEFLREKMEEDSRTTAEPKYEARIAEIEE